MVRKQVYLEEAQSKALKQRAKELGMPESEVVRRALDMALRYEGLPPTQKQREAALKSFLEDAERLSKTHRFPEGYRFDRQALYEEDKRFTRWGKEQP